MNEVFWFIIVLAFLEVSIGILMLYFDEVWDFFKRKIKEKKRRRLYI